MPVLSFSPASSGQQVESTVHVEKQQNRALKQDLNNPSHLSKVKQDLDRTSCLTLFKHDFRIPKKLDTTSCLKLDGT